jgi:hypothetical protein
MSLLFVSFTQTWSSSPEESIAAVFARCVIAIHHLLDNTPLKDKRAAIQGISVVKNLEGTIRDVKFMGLNMKCLIFLFLQFMIYQYSTFIFSVFKYFSLRSNMKGY